MILAAAFLLCFVAGPLIFREATQGDPTRGQLRAIAWITIVMSGTAMAIRYGLAPQWGNNLILTFCGILLIWLAWIGVLAFGTQSLRSMDRSARMRRWSRVMGALGTTVPWFGLASADALGVSIT